LFRSTIAGFATIMLSASSYVAILIPAECSHQHIAGLVKEKVSFKNMRKHRNLPSIPYSHGHWAAYISPGHSV
jgi:hypothetical protein